MAWGTLRNALVSASASGLWRLKVEGGGPAVFGWTDVAMVTVRMLGMAFMVDIRREWGPWTLVL